MRLILITAFVTGCSAAPATPPAETQKPTVAATPAPATNEAVSRADALLADLAKRQADYRVAEQNAPPPPPAPTLADFAPASMPAPTPAAAPMIAAMPVAAATPAAAPPSATVRDEAWWKDRMRVLQAKLDEDQRLLITARAQADSATLRLTFDQATAEVNRLIAVVASDRAAIGSLEEEARRANIPPGWLRP